MNGVENARKTMQSGKVKRFEQQKGGKLSTVIGPLFNSRNLTETGSL